MKVKLLLISIVLFVAWTVGFFVMQLSAIIHTTLWLSVIFLLRSVFVQTPGDIAAARR